jgi:hypothetical protein
MARHVQEEISPLSLADLFRVHADERIRAALNQAYAKNAQGLLASAQEHLEAAHALQASKQSTLVQMAACRKLG